MRALVYLLALGVLALGGLAYYRRSHPPVFEMMKAPEGAESGPVAVELPRLWLLPDFALTERSGQLVTLSTLRGSVWIADFFYTTCPGPCPMLTSRFSALQKELAGEKEMRFVSISSDPEKDTPAILQEYAQHFGASEQWLFLTGDKRAIYTLANQGFKLSLVEDATNAQERIAHSTKLALVDRTGTVRGVYDGLGEEGKAKLLRDTRLLLAEKL